MEQKNKRNIEQVVLIILTDHVTTRYFCKVCNENHEITLSKDLLKEHKDFPFAFVYLHGKTHELVTTLYIDANLKIRGVEVTTLSEGSNLFSSEFSQSIAQTLVNEIQKLTKENEELKKRVIELEAQLKKK